MNTEKLKNLVGEKLQELCDDELIELWNEYCERFGSPDSKIFYMGEFDSEYANLKTESPEDIVRRVQKNFSDFDPDDSFFVGGDDVESFNNPKGYIDTDELVDALIEERMECAAVHIDELKKQCGDLRMYEDPQEFRLDTGFDVGDVIKYRFKDDTEHDFCGVYDGYRYGDSCWLLFIGGYMTTFKGLFEQYEYYDYGREKWRPFGVAEE